jgi:hypothetical protein
MNIISKSLVLEAFLDKLLSFSHKRLQWVSGQPIETEGNLRVIQQRLESMGSS